MLQSCIYCIVLLLLLLLFFSTLRFLQLTNYLHHTNFEHAILEYIHLYLKKKHIITFLKVYYLLKRDI